jgi:hypothetical protein
MSRKAAGKGAKRGKKRAKKDPPFGGRECVLRGAFAKQTPVNVHRPYVFMISSATKRREMQRSIACFSI